MNKIYLDKVVKQMVDETVKVGSDRDEYISTPFYSPLPLLRPWHLRSYATLPFSPHFNFFEDYVIKVYGLTKRESKYVWKEYKEKIINRF